MDSGWILMKNLLEYKEMMSVNYLSVLDDTERKFMRNLCSPPGVRRPYRRCYAGPLPGDSCLLNRENVLRMVGGSTARIVLPGGFNGRAKHLILSATQFLPATEERQEQRQYENKNLHNHTKLLKFPE